MLWYGFETNPKLSKIKNRNKFLLKKSNKQTKLLNFSINYAYNKDYSFTYLSLFNLWDVVIYKQNLQQNFIHLFIYSNIYFFLLPLNTYNFKIYFNKSLWQLNFLVLSYNNFYTLYWFFLKNIFYSFSNLFFLKLSFKGKGYYVYKNNRNTIALRFGYSHRIYLYAYFISLIFITKTIILLFGLNKNDILTFAYNFYKTKPINIFTGRGVRFSRQIIYKKTGKISSYH